MTRDLSELNLRPGVTTTVGGWEGPLPRVSELWAGRGAACELASNMSAFQAAKGLLPSDAV